ERRRAVSLARHRQSHARPLCPYSGGYAMSRLADRHYPLRHRLFRALWILTWAVLAAWTPPPLHAWRCFLLRLFGARIGRGVRIYASANIWYPPNLLADDGSVIGWRTVIYC